MELMSAKDAEETQNLTTVKSLVYEVTELLFRVKDRGFCSKEGFNRPYEKLRRDCQNARCPDENLMRSFLRTRNSLLLILDYAVGKF